MTINRRFRRRLERILLRSCYPSLRIIVLVYYFLALLICLLNNRLFNYFWSGMGLLRNESSRTVQRRRRLRLRRDFGDTSVWLHIRIGYLLLSLLLILLTLIRVLERNSIGNLLLRVEFLWRLFFGCRNIFIRFRIALKLRLFLF